MSTYININNNFNLHYEINFKSQRNSHPWGRDPKYCSLNCSCSNKQHARSD